MTAVDIKALALILHDMGHTTTKTKSHVYQVWEDGEITLTKCGDLYGLRSLHMTRKGQSEVRVAMPHAHGKHSYAAVGGSKDAKQLSDAIFALAGLEAR